MMPFFLCSFRLAQMTEAEREAELFARYEKREAAKTRFEIEQKLKRAKQKEKGHKKRSSKGGKFIRDSDTVKKTNRAKAMEELAAQRAAERKKKENEPQKDTHYSVQEMFGSDDDEEEGEEEGAKETVYDDGWDEDAGRE